MKRNRFIIEKRYRRSRRIRAKIFGTSAKPRLSVFRSNKFIYVQLIDDESGRTLVSVSNHGLGKKAGAKTAQAGEVGRMLAEHAVKMGIKAVVFDRGAYKYHGRVKAVADGARKAGLKI